MFQNAHFPASVIFRRQPLLRRLSGLRLSWAIGVRLVRRLQMQYVQNVNLLWRLFKTDAFNLTVMQARLAAPLGLFTASFNKYPLQMIAPRQCPIRLNGINVTSKV